jgi:hypothetical protein
MLAKTLVPLLVVVVFFPAMSSPALAYKSLKVPEAYPKVEPFHPTWNKPRTNTRHTWWRHYGRR